MPKYSLAWCYECSRGVEQNFGSGLSTGTTGSGPKEGPQGISAWASPANTAAAWRQNWEEAVHCGSLRAVDLPVPRQPLCNLGVCCRAGRRRGQRIRRKRPGCTDFGGGAGGRLAAQINLVISV